MKTRPELGSAIDDLAARTPRLLAETPANDQMSDFAGLAKHIEESSASESRTHAWSRLKCIVREHGLVPGNEVPCSECIAQS